MKNIKRIVIILMIVSIIAGNYEKAFFFVSAGNKEALVKGKAVSGGAITEELPTIAAGESELYNRKLGNTKDFSGAMYLIKDSFSGSATGEASARYKICVDDIENIVMVSEIKQNSQWGGITRKIGIADTMTTDKFVKHSGSYTGGHLNEWKTQTVTDILDVSELSGNYFLNIYAGVKDGSFKVQRIYVKFKQGSAPTEEFKITSEKIFLTGKDARKDITGGWTKSLTVAHGENWGDTKTLNSRTQNIIDFSSLGEIVMTVRSDGVMWPDCWAHGGYANASIGYSDAAADGSFQKKAVWSRKSTGQDDSVKNGKAVLAANGADKGYLKVQLNTKGSNLTVTGIYAVTDENTAPIVIQSKPKTVYEGETAVFSAMVNYRGNSIEYQWYDAQTDMPILGNPSAQTSCLEIKNCSLEDDGKKYYLKATDEKGNSGGKREEAAVLNVIKALEIEEIEHKEGMEGELVSFEVQAESRIEGGRLSYQWLKNGEVLNGKTENICTVTADRIDDGAEYSCAVFLTSPLLQEGKTGKESGKAVLTVNYPPDIMKHPENQKVLESETAVFSIMAEEGKPNGLFYQWEKFSEESGAYEPIPGAVSSSYKFQAAFTDTGSSYRCRVSNQKGLAVTSDSAGLKVEQKELTGIRIAVAPKKTLYIEEQNFDAGGMVVIADYNNGTSAEIKEYEILNEKALLLGQTEIIIRYTERKVTKTAFQPIIVSKRILSGIRITVPPKKTVYLEGENFAPEAMQVTADYNSGVSHIVTEYNILDGASLREGQGQIKVSYTEGGITKTAVQRISVTKKKLTGIRVTAPPKKQTYIESEDFIKSGMEVTADYDNGNSAVIHNFTVINGKNLKLGQKVIKIEYTEDKIVKSTETPVKVGKKKKQEEKENRRLTAQYTGTSVIEGGRIDDKRVIVKLYDANGRSEQIESFTIKPYVIQCGTNCLTVQYQELTAEFLVEGHRNADNGAKLTALYYGPQVKKGGEIEKKYLTVILSYPGRVNMEITDYTLNPYTIHSGTNILTVNYAKLTAEFKVRGYEEKPFMPYIKAEYKGNDVFVGGEVMKSDIVVYYYEGKDNYKKVEDFTLKPYKIIIGKNLLDIEYQTLLTTISVSGKEKPEVSVREEQKLTSAEKTQLPEEEGLLYKDKQGKKILSAVIFLLSVLLLLLLLFLIYLLLCNAKIYMIREDGTYQLLKWKRISYSKAIQANYLQITIHKELETKHLSVVIKSSFVKRHLGERLVINLNGEKEEHEIRDEIRLLIKS